MTKKMRKPLPQPDVIAAVKIVREIRKYISHCTCSDPATCAREPKECLNCRHCRDQIIRQIAKILRLP